MMMIEHFQHFQHFPGTRAKGNAAVHLGKFRAICAMRTGVDLLGTSGDLNLDKRSGEKLEGTWEGFVVLWREAWRSLKKFEDR